jgi:hypothetical protein
MPFDPSTAQPLDPGASSPAPSGKFDPSTATLAESEADQPQSFMDKMRAAAGSVGHLINPLEPFAPEKLEAGPRMLDALTFAPHLGAQGGAILGSLARGNSLEEAVGAGDLVPSFTQDEAKTPVGKAIDTGMAIPGDVARELGRQSEEAAKTYQKLGMGGLPVPFLNLDAPPEIAGAGAETIANAAMLALGGRAGDASGLLPWEQRVRAAPERIIPEPKDLPGASTAPPPLQLTHQTDIAQGDPVGQQVKAKAKDLVAMASEAAAAATKPPPASPIPAPAAPPATIGTGGGTTPPPPPPAVAAALHAATGGDKGKMADVIAKATGGNLKPGETPENLADMAHAAIQQTPTGSGAPLPPSTPLNIAPVPLAGGVLHTTGGPEIAIDPRMPATVTVPHAQTGAPVQVDTHTGVKAHESVEWPLMHLYAPLTDADLAGVASRAGLASPDELPAAVVAKLRKGEALTYPEAHDIATLSENHHYATQYGVNPEHVQKAMTDGINAAKAQAPTEAVPPTLDVKPYVDDNKTHLLPGVQPIGALQAPPTPAAPTLKPAPAAPAPEPIKLTGNPITDRFAAQLQDFDKARDDYSKLEDSNGGTVLNTDTARELSADYLADRTKSPDVHEPASAFIKKLYAAKLAEPTPAGTEPTVLFTGGGTGAGKSTGLGKLESDFKPEITYDTNMNTYASSKQKIEQALGAGRKVKILYTYRDPAEALRNGAFPRAMNQAKKYGTGRTLTLGTHAETHEGSFDVVHRLSREYNGDGRVEIFVLDNSRGKGQSEFVPLDQIPDPRSKDLRERLQQQLEEAHAAGEISDPVYAGFGGKGGGSTGLGTSDKGQLEPQRGQVTSPPQPPVPEATAHVDIAVAALEQSHPDAARDLESAQAGTASTPDAHVWQQFLAENKDNPRVAEALKQAVVIASKGEPNANTARELQAASGSEATETVQQKPPVVGDQGSEQEAGPGSAPESAAGKPGSTGAKVDDYPEGEPLDTASIAPSLSEISELAHKAIPDLDKIVDDALTKVAPMAAGSDEARATAKDFANEMRLATHEGNVADDMLKKNFTREQQTRMWQAADEQSVMEQSGEGVQSGKGMSTLSPEEAKAVRALQAKARKVYEQARDLGMVEGEGLPSYTPRMVVVMSEGGPRPPGADAARAKGGTGANVRTTTGSLKERKHMTTAETQAAARARFDETAKVVQNIRTLPLATARLARAVAGRTLINRVKEIGAQTGTDTVREGSAPNDGHTWFTLDHPSFQTWRPRFEDGEDGKVRAVTDTEGNPVFDKIPLYVRGDFKGPLKAIMSEEQGPIYRGLMQLKAKTMTVVMYSPLIHNAVEWGRALPAAPGKVGTFRIYFEGNRAKNDPATMREAIKAGLVPIGHGGAMQDITGIEQGDQVAPGRSWTAKLLGAIPGLFSAKAGDAVKAAIDKAGDFWHNTLLWDRVADLQMGLYTNMRDAMVRKGMTPQTAQRIAAHLANRYAGALPKEAMSSAAQKLANVLMFSRTFTLGNIGAMKDALTGLPRDVAAQIKRDAPEEAEKAKTYAKRKALGIIAIDIALMYAGNSLLQSAVSMMRGDTDLEEEEKEYLARMGALMQRVKENPMDMLHPLDALQSLSSTSKNEPGKQDRVLVGHADDGTAIYMRNPVGKIGEEFVGWLSSPLDKMRSKVSTLARPAVETITNDKGFGRKVYDPYDNAPGAAVRNIGRIAANIMGDQVPLQALQAAKDYYDGVGESRLNLAQVFGPLGGLTFSKGAPGGEAVGELYAAKEEQKFKVDEAMPGIRKHIQAGDVDGAIDTMQGLGMAPSYIKWVVMTTQDPSLRISKRAMQDFDKYATPDERERMDRALGKAPPQ